MLTKPTSGPIINSSLCNNCDVRKICTAIIKAKPGRQGWNPAGYPGQIPCPAVLSPGSMEEEHPDYLENYRESRYEQSGKLRSGC